MSSQKIPATNAGQGWLLQPDRMEERRRERLTRAQIVDGALRIIDADGMDALTMRRLGDELGVRAMAMYRHVQDKNQLLDLVIEGILGAVEMPPRTGDWRADAAAVARATRSGIMRHRHAVALLSSRPWVGPAGLAGVDLVIGIFRAAGLDDRTATYAQFALANFVSGFCGWEAANFGGVAADPQSRARALEQYRQFVEALPPARFPDLVAVAPVLVAGTLDERFDQGLEFLLDGIGAAVSAARKGS